MVLSATTLSGVISEPRSTDRGSRSVIEIDFRNDPRWEEFVASHPDGSIYHHPAWLRALEEEYGQRVVCLACVDSFNQLVGVLPLMSTRGLPFNWGGQFIGRRLASLPRTPIAGPLTVDDAATAMLLRAGVDLVQGVSGLQLQVKSMCPKLDALCNRLVGAPWKEMYILDLPEKPEELRFGDRATRHRVKGAVNRALKLGVSVRAADSEHDLVAWYNLYLETIRWHGSIPKNYRFFSSLWRQLHPRGQMELLLAEHRQGGQATLLSGYMLLMCSKTVHCYLNGRRRDQLGLHPNDLLQWHAIQEACRRGYRRYDFGEVEEGQEGLIGFKVKWGARPLRSHRYYYPTPRKIPVVAASGGAVECLSKWVWRHVPLRAATFLSDWLYSYL